MILKRMNYHAKSPPITPFHSEDLRARPRSFYDDCSDSRKQSATFEASCDDLVSRMEGWRTGNTWTSLRNSTHFWHTCSKKSERTTVSAQILIRPCQYDSQAAPIDHDSGYG